MGFRSIRRKFILSSKIKGHVPGICILYGTFVIVRPFAPLLRCLWLNLYSPEFLGISVTTPSTEKTKGYTDTLFSFQILLLILLLVVVVVCTL